MEIRKADKSDLEEIRNIYDRARIFMKNNGNPNQWDNGYPSDTVILNDIASGNSYVMEENGDIQGVFVFIIGVEPTYAIIEDGYWNSEKTYGTIHRIASAGMKKGVTKSCFDYCSSKIDYLRIDTHQDNKSMQAAINKYGFKYCGIIHVRNGNRLAFDYLSKDS